MTTQLTALDDLFGGDSAADPDPSRVDHDRRRQTRIAPDHVDVTALPAPFVECGCGDCPEYVNPLSDNSLQTDPDLQVYAADECPDPRPVDVETARRVYVAYVRSRMQRDEETSKHGYDRLKYATILDTDRILRESYTGLTTAMVTRRLSPLDDRGQWLPPWTLDEMLHGGGVSESVRNAIDYQLKENHRYEYVAVTAVTEPAATPHEHIWLWIEDPDDAVEKSWFDSAIAKHVEKCENADKSHHMAREDGSGGAITVQQSPELLTDPPDKFGSILAQSDSGDDTRIPRNTRGAVYVASQLPHLHIGDLTSNQTPNPPDTLLEGGAIAWATPHRWYRSSGGIGKALL